MALPRIRTITIDKWDGGIASNGLWTPNPEFIKGKEGQLGYVVGMDPYRFPGVICPGPAMTDSLTNISSVTTNVRKFLRRTLVESGAENRKIYALGGSQINEIDPDVVSTTAPFPKTVDHGHANEMISDAIMYQLNSAWRMFYTFNDETDSDMGMFDFSTFDDDYLSTVPTNAALLGTVAGGSGMHPHSLAVGDNNILYIANGSVLDQLDGRAATAVYTAAKIDTRLGNIIKDHLAYKGFHWIGTKIINATTGLDFSNVHVFSRTGSAAVYIWNYISSNFEDVIPLTGDSDILKMEIYNGIPYILTKTYEGFVRLRKWNGREFEQVVDLATDTKNEFPWGGTFRYHNLLCWISASSGEVICHGRPSPEQPVATNSIWKVSDNAISAIIEVAENAPNSGTYYVADNEASLRIKKLSISSAGGFGAGAAQVRSLVYDLPWGSRLHWIKLYFPTFTYTGATRTMIVAVSLNRSSSYTTAEAVDFDTVEGAGYRYIPFNQNNVSSFQLRLTYSGNIAAAQPCIMPAKIEIGYSIPRDKRR